MFLFNTCHESLPLRLDPARVFDGAIEARYVLSNPQFLVENNIEVCLKVTNIYDETLQAKAILAGNLTITLKDDTSYHRTVPLGTNNIISANYDRNTQILTMDPCAFIHLRYVWDFRDDNGQDLRNSLLAVHADPSCPYRHIANPATIIVSGNLKIFDRTEVVWFGPIQFTFTYSDVFTKDTDCPPVTTDSPCGSIN
jgi:hypothetical protein